MELRQGSHFGLHRPYRTNQTYLTTESSRLVASQSDLPSEVPLPLPSRAGPCEQYHAASESRREPELRSCGPHVAHRICAVQGHHAGMNVEGTELKRLVLISNRRTKMDRQQISRVDAGVGGAEVIVASFGRALETRRRG